MEVRGGEGGKEDFSVSVGFIWKTDRQAGQKKSNIVAALAMWDTKICSFWENRCKIGKPFKRNAFVAAAGKLYLLIRFTFLLG
ncbi:hypothetical protein T07_10000 [Trichinella nelsoni]|uniref:Uncharacterized protein n=1 Tax=Trichinella nelsoni TaxID=6336 RepID=A0A0V0RCD7_9BILA|nr:hypothetical protein T07_10000 [Trichinella nelsoni]